MKRLIPSLLLAAALPAHADTHLWLDAYGGHVTDQDGRLSLHQDNLFSPDQNLAFDFDPDLDPMLGLRLRAEIDPVPFGLGIDIGYTRVHDPRADLRLMPVTLGLTLPSGLTLAKGGWGSLHPVGMVGLVATGVDGSVRAGPIASEVNDNTWAGGGGRIGGSIGLGLEWRLSPRVALFSEYRYQRLRFHLEHTDDPTLPTTSLETRGDIKDQAVLVGISFHLLHQAASPAAGAAAPAPATP